MKNSMSPNASLPMTVAIPTYRREAVLIATIEYLLELTPRAAEILVLDQTESHEPETEVRLQQMADEGLIHWAVLAEPSIPKAMNEGLRRASQELVLFVDDDIRPEPGLLTAHQAAHSQHRDVLVAGRVVQPWQEGVDYTADTTIHLAGLRAGWIHEFIGCNFSVRRLRALDLGGFDENFVRVAYRYEAEFAHRLKLAGVHVWFEPAACLHHLKDVNGGTRTYGHHLTTWRPDHAVGDYYYALRTGRWKILLTRPFKAAMTGHHLRHPWHLPATLLAELRGMIWALSLNRKGRNLTPSPTKESAID
jgi:GT2 family glycosyltransferase